MSVPIKFRISLVEHTPDCTHITITRHPGRNLIGFHLKEAPNRINWFNYADLAPDGAEERAAYVHVYRSLRTEGVFIECKYSDSESCVGPLEPRKPLEVTLQPSDPNGIKKSSAKTNRKRATQCEKKVAKELGGVRHKGSGCLSYLKGDVRVKGKFRIESKFTRQKSFSVTRAILNKLWSECGTGEVPMLDVTFVDPATLVADEEWVLVPRSTFKVE